MIKLKPIPEWRQAWRMLSVQIPAVTLMICGAWLAMPAQEQAAIVALLGVDPARWMPLLGLIGGILGRVIRQPELHEGCPVTFVLVLLYLLDSGSYTVAETPSVDGVALTSESCAAHARQAMSSTVFDVAGRTVLAAGCLRVRSGAPDA